MTEDAHLLAAHVLATTKAQDAGMQPHCSETGGSVIYWTAAEVTV